MTANNNPYKKTVTHSFLYGISDILRKIVSFLMLPIYTRYLSPEGYGVVEMMMIAIAVMEIFLGARMGQAIFRYYFMEKDAEMKKTVFSTALIITIIASTIAYIVLYFNADTATQIMLGDTTFANLMAMLGLILVTQVLEEYGFIYIRIHQRPLLFLIVGVFKLLLQVGLNVYFLVFRGMGVEGVIYSALLSTGTMAVLSLSYCYYYSGVRFSKELAKKLFLFSYPVWLTGIGGIYVGSGDKYFLRLFSGLEEVGIYSLGAKFGFLVLVLVWGPFSKIWETQCYEIYNSENAKKIYANLFMMLVVILSFIGLGIALFTENVLWVMSDKSFWPASGIVPILVLTQIIQSLTFFNNFGLLLREKTIYLFISTFVKAIVITILFLALIPVTGIYGAAIACLGATIAQLIVVVFVARKQYDMELPWMRVSIVLTIWIAFVALSFLVPDDFIISLLLKSLIVTLFIAALFVLPVFEPAFKEMLYAKVKKITNGLGVVLKRN